MSACHCLCRVVFVSLSCGCLEVTHLSEPHSESERHLWRMVHPPASKEEEELTKLCPKL